jgi:predicted DNA-binding WGR domain protein
LNAICSAPSGSSATGSRIGTNGQELVEVFATELEAGQALEAIARVKRQREYKDL